MFLLALVILLLVPNGFVCLRCVPEDIYEETSEGFDSVDELRDRRSVSADDAKAIRGAHVCRVQITYVPEMGQVTVQYFGNNVPYDLSDELMVTQVLMVMKGGFTSSVNTINYACTYSDYCESDFVDDWMLWIKTINNPSLERQVLTIIQSHVVKSDESGICYKSKSAQSCPTGICSVEWKNNMIIDGCVAQTNEMPSLGEHLAQIKEFLIGTVSMSIAVNLTVLNIKQFQGQIQNMLFAKQLHTRHVAFVCMHNECNEQSVLMALLPVIERGFTLQTGGVRRSSVEKGTAESTSTLEQKERAEGLAQQRQRFYEMITPLRKILQAAVQH